MLRGSGALSEGEAREDHEHRQLSPSLRLLCAYLLMLRLHSQVLHHGSLAYNRSSAAIRMESGVHGRRVCWQRRHFRILSTPVRSDVDFAGQRSYNGDSKFPLKPPSGLNPTMALSGARKGTVGMHASRIALCTRFAPLTHTKGTLMNTIIYIVGVVVIVLAILWFFGLR
jgi:hypothetical protein